MINAAAPVCEIGYHLTIGSAALFSEIRYPFEIAAANPVGYIGYHFTIVAAALFGEIDFSS